MTVKINKGLQKVKDLIGQKPEKKPPAYPWQELALQIIDELNIPLKKRNSVFLICKQHPRKFVEKCLADTKELCKTGEKWRYFFKLISQEKSKKS